MHWGAFGNHFKCKVYEQYYCRWLFGLTGMIAPHTPTGSCLVIHMKLSSVEKKGAVVQRLLHDVFVRFQVPSCNSPMAVSLLSFLLTFLIIPPSIQWWCAVVLWFSGLGWLPAPPWPSLVSHTDRLPRGSSLFRLPLSLYFRVSPRLTEAFWGLHWLTHTLTWRYWGHSWEEHPQASCSSATLTLRSQTHADDQVLL